MFILSEVLGSKTAYACGNIGYEYLGPAIGKSIADSRIQCTKNAPRILSVLLQTMTRPKMHVHLRVNV